MKYSEFPLQRLTTLCRPYIYRELATRSAHVIWTQT